MAPAGPGRPAQWREKMAEAWWADKGPSWAAGGRLGLPLSLSLLMNKKQYREKKERKERLGGRFAHGDNIPGLTKMSSIQEK